MNENSAPDFTAMAAKFMSRWSNSQIIIIVETEGGGVETLRTNPSIAWSLGMLKIAEQMFTQLIEENRNRSLEKQISDQAEAEISALVIAEKGKSN